MRTCKKKKCNLFNRRENNISINVSLRKVIMKKVNYLIQ